LIVESIETTDYIASGSGQSVNSRTIYGITVRYADLEIVNPYTWTGQSTCKYL